MKLFKRWKSFKKSSGKDTDAQHDEDDEDLADELEEFSELGNDGNTFCDDVISIARFRVSSINFSLFHGRCRSDWVLQMTEQILWILTSTRIFQG